MANMNERVLGEILRRHGDTHPVPRVFLETGTLFAQTSTMARRLAFPCVISIELERNLHALARQNFGHHLGLHFVLGDSRVLVPEYAVRLEEPVLWYLDAHWYQRDGVAGQGRFPLWHELYAIALRPYPDIVVVDDVNSFESTLPEPDWHEVSGEAIDSALGRVFDSGVINDQWCVWREAA